MKAELNSRFSCPSCRSTRVSKAQYEGVVEQTLLRLVEICPFVCHSCELRFYMFAAASVLRRPELAHTWPAAERYKSALSLN